MRAQTFVILVLGSFLLLFAQGVLSFASSADDPARALALDQSKAEASSLLEKGEAGKAYDLYMRLLRLAPDDDGVNLGLARAAAKAGRWNQAVMAYETLLEKYPREAGLYGEMAHVYMLLGDREAAERSLAVMRSLDARITREETDKALDVLASRYSDFQAHGKIRAGIQYDSNANLGPDSGLLDLGSWRGVRVDNAKAQSSLGAYLGADVDLGKRFYRDSPWWLVGDVQGFWRGHAQSDLHKARSQEAQWGRAAAGLRHLAPSTLAEVRLKAEIFDYEFYNRVSACGPEGTLLWAASPSLHLVAKGALEHREYSRDHGRSALAGSAGLYSRIFFGSDNHELLLGGRYFGTDAKKRDYSHEGWETMARSLFKLPHGFELAPFISFTRERYKGPATALETKNRLDERFRAGLGLTYRINESWAVEGNCQYTKNRSNSALYKYDQRFVSLGVAWNF